MKYRSFIGIRTRRTKYVRGPSEDRYETSVKKIAVISGMIIIHKTDA